VRRYLFSLAASKATSTKWFISFTRMYYYDLWERTVSQIINNKLNRFGQRQWQCFLGNIFVNGGGTKSVWLFLLCEGTTGNSFQQTHQAKVNGKSRSFGARLMTFWYCPTPAIKACLAFYLSTNSTHLRIHICIFQQQQQRQRQLLCYRWRRRSMCFGFVYCYLAHAAAPVYSHIWEVLSRALSRWQWVIKMTATVLQHW